MDAVKLLKDDHKKVKDLFRQFEKARSADRKKTIAEEAMHELEVHAEIEEEIFYPAAKAKADKEGKELVAEAVEEHHVVKVLIGELKALAPEDDRYAAKFTVLTENVEHHIEEEEGQLFPLMGQQLGSAASEELGRRMEEHKQSLLQMAESGH